MISSPSKARSTNDWRWNGTRPTGATDDGFVTFNGPGAVLVHSRAFRTSVLERMYCTQYDVLYCTVL